MVVYASEDGYGVLVLPADMTADFAEVRRLMGLSAIRLATAEEIARLFPHCEPGALPPVADLAGITVLMDETLATADFIATRDAAPISGDDFHRVVGPLVAAFSLTPAESRKKEAPCR